MKLTGGELRGNYPTVCRAGHRACAPQTGEPYAIGHGALLSSGAAGYHGGQRSMMRHVGDIATLVGCLLAALIFGACDCGGDSRLATLVERSGDVQRDTASNQEQWSTAAVGSDFGLGDGVWLQGEGRAVLELQGGQRLAMRPDSILRFGGGGEKEPQFAMVAGEALLSVFGEPFTLRTEFGTARIEANSRIRLTRQGDQELYAVELGSARFTGGGGGEGIMAMVGNAVLMAPDGPTVVTPKAPEASGSGASEGEVSLPYEIAIETEGGKVRRPDSREFEALQPGTHNVEVGTVLRLPAKASATVRRGEETVVATGAGDFELIGKTGAQLKAEGGRLHVTAQSKPVQVDVPGGRILVDVVEGGSDAQVRFDETGALVAVTRGQARLDYGSEEIVLQEGMTGTVPNAAVQAERDEVLGEQGPERADFQVRAGETFVLHTPSVPVVVGILAPSKCKEGAVVKMARSQRVRGQRQVNVTIGHGRVPYGVYCIEGGHLGRKRVASGAMTTITDAGTRQLPKAPPDAMVDTDGLRYTVIYQNQPPKISVRWPKAPAATAYVLHVSGPRTDERIKTKEPRKDFGSGALRDGVHQVVFETSTGKRSPRTTLDIRFDNVASTASVSAPQEKGFHVGDKVSVAGVALPGWKVAVEGGTLEFDRQRRFTGEVKTSESRPNVAIRLSHARRGVHYYLRRAAAQE